MNILISGYNGFVGQNLLTSIDDKFKVHTLSRKLRHNGNGFGPHITWDTLTQQSLQYIDAVVHLAGKAHDLKQVSQPEEYFQVNTELTKKLFDLFLESSARDFIYFSSVKAAADRVEGILDESVVPSPYTPYGLSKLKAEEYLLSKTLSKGKRLFILRPCMIHGPGNKGNLNLLYQFVKKGIPYPLAGFNNSRSFLSIDNLAYIIQRLLTEADIPGGIYHIADDDPLSTNEVIKIIGEASNIIPRLWAIPSKAIKFSAKIGDKLHLPLNTERLKKLTESYVVDNTKIKAALQIDSLPVSSKNGLYSTIKNLSAKQIN
jgi:nucleoside-diphosphate-sugar epimerase